MGNVEMHESISFGEEKETTRELNLSSVQDYRSYCKHLSGDYSDTCLKEFPPVLTNTVHMCERATVSFNCLETLPDNLPCGLPHLTHLDASYNQLTSLPESIGLLIHLKELLLAHNCLKILPKSIVRLTNLEKLDLSHNVLQGLPERLSEMKCLRKLNVSYNVLKSLPLSLGINEELEVLLSTNNQCKSVPPQEICDAGSKATLKFLRELAQSKHVSRRSKNVNVFPRHRSYIVKSSVPNPHSARAQYVQRQTETLNTASRIRTPLLPPLNSTKLSSSELKDNVIGLIYGAAIGDALGIATEFLTPDQSMFYYDENNFSYKNIIQDEHRAHWKKGDWTSNTDQMLLVLDSLLHWAGVIDELEFAKRLVSWKTNGLQELGRKENYMYSNTVNLVLQEESYAQNPHQVAQDIMQNGWSERINGSIDSEPLFSQLSIDSGALPRSVILGIPHFHDLQEVVSNSVRICRATHYDERCVASCVSLSVAIALMLQGSLSWTDVSSVNSMLQTAEDYGAAFIEDDVVREEFRKFGKYIDFESICLIEAGRLCHAFKSYATAFCALRQQMDMRTVLSSVWMCGGYSSMNGCIAGAVLGCKHGFSKLPIDWVQGLLKVNTDFLNAKINALLDMMGLP